MALPEEDVSFGGKLYAAIFGHKRGERSGLFGYISQSERVARASEANARIAARTLRLAQQRERQLQQQSHQRADGSSVVQDLHMLADLRDRGVLNEAQFEEAKRKVIPEQTPSVTAAHYSADGRFWWDGNLWRSTTSSLPPPSLLPPPPT